MAVVAAMMPAGGGGRPSPTGWLDEAAELARRPALRAWNLAHERERKRLGLKTQHAYATQVIGCDPGDWSKWRRARGRVPEKWGLSIVFQHPGERAWVRLWSNLWQEYGALALHGALEEGPGSG